MDIIVKDRGAGKTTALIHQSAKTYFYIVTRNHETAHAIFQQASALGLKIPFPLTYGEFIEHRYYGAGVRGILIDDADELLQSMANVPIHAITLTQRSEK